MDFLKYVGFKRNEKDDIKRMIKWIIISYILIGIGLLIQFLILKLEYSEFIIRVKTITLRGFIGYGLYALIQEIVARGVLQQWIKTLTKSSFWSIIITTTIFCLCHLFFNYFIIFGAFIISIICGVVFDKNKDIMSCFLIHFIIGGLGKMLLFI